MLFKETAHGILIGKASDFGNLAERFPGVLEKIYNNMKCMIGKN